MKKSIIIFVSGCLLISPAFAQGSAASRAQQLEKLEEDMNSPDPNVRLAAFEDAMESASPAMRTKAKRLGLSSEDVDLKSLALRYAVCQSSDLSIFAFKGKTVNYNGREQGPMFGIVSPLFQLSLASCEVTTGKFVLENRYDFDKKASGVIKGLNVSIGFVARSGTGTPECDFNGKFENQAVIGRVICVDRGDNDVFDAEVAELYF